MFSWLHDIRPLFLLQFPSGDDDLLLQFRQPHILISALVSLLVLTLIFGSARLVGAENFFKRTNLGKKHVAERAAHFSVRRVIIRPGKIRNHLIHRHAELFQRDLVGELAFLVGPRGLPQLDELDRKSVV